MNNDNHMEAKHGVEKTKIKDLRDLFRYHRRVAFYETDAMGVVHHAQYLHYFEEARVAWLRDRGFMEYHYPYAPFCLAVLESHCVHERPLRFDEEFEILVTLRREGLKLRFCYALYRKKDFIRHAQAETLLVCLDMKLKPCRLRKELIAHLEKESWIETWPLSL